MGAMRSSFFIIDKDHVGSQLQADMWDDGWAFEKTTMPRKKVKIKYATVYKCSQLCRSTGLQMTTDQLIYHGLGAHELVPADRRVGRRLGFENHHLSPGRRSR